MIYYRKHFDVVNGVINAFNQNEAKYIKNAHNLFHNKKLQNELDIITKYFHF